MGKRGNYISCQVFEIVFLLCLYINFFSFLIRVCGFTGDYYCHECHIGEEWVIPAKVIYNWDFRRYPVSKKSSLFLNDIQHHPLIDLKVLNPVLYFAVEEMSQLQVILTKVLVSYM